MGRSWRPPLLSTRIDLPAGLPTSNEATTATFRPSTAAYRYNRKVEQTSQASKTQQPPHPTTTDITSLMVLPQNPYDKPRVRVYTEYSVVLGEPNILICSVANIFPPVMNITWLKNGEKVALGVTETIFLPCQDHSFLKFLYLAFIPTVNDIYTCEVEHWGLDGPKRVFWELEVPPVQSETTQTVVCALGLSVGIIGIIAGVVLLMKGVKHNTEQRMRGNY